jgi:glycosyltransferase involved in cell wall biosynthesis
MRSKRRLIHLTTADISLELLLGPQLSAFAEEGYEVIGVSAPGEYVPAIESRGVRHVALTHATRSMSLRSDFGALKELTQLFRSLRPDIVHTHNPKPGVYGRLAAKAARVPVIVNTVHGLYALPEDPLPKRAVVYGLERIAAACSDAELVQNPEDIQTLRALGIPADRIFELGNGIDLSRFSSLHAATARQEVRAELELSPDAIVVGAVGRLVREKGYPELFTAWEGFAANHPAAVLVVAGPEEPEKADAIAPELRARAERCGIRFLGMRRDVDRLYHALDVYVLASHREGYPRSAMEASACGLPIVATNIRGCRQVVEDGTTGILVPPRDPIALGAALERLIRDAGLRASMGAAARSRAAAEFDQQRVIDITLATYARLLGRSRS